MHSCCLSYSIYGMLLRQPELRHLPNFKTPGNEKQDENPGRLVPESVFLSLARIIPVGFPGGSAVKNPPAMQETWVQFLGWEDSLKKEMATYSSILAWKIPWTESLVGYSSRGCRRVWHNLAAQQQLLKSTSLYWYLWQDCTHSGWYGHRLYWYLRFQSTLQGSFVSPLFPCLQLLSPTVRKLALFICNVLFTVQS